MNDIMLKNAEAASEVMTLNDSSFDEIISKGLREILKTRKSKDAGLSLFQVMFDISAYMASHSFNVVIEDGIPLFNKNEDYFEKMVHCMLRILPKIVPSIFNQIDSNQDPFTNPLGLPTHYEGIRKKARKYIEMENSHEFIRDYFVELYRK
jgi:hypothetical protein